MIQNLDHSISVPIKEPARTPDAILATHARLRCEGFPMVSILCGRRIIDGRVYLSNWLASRPGGMVLAPEPEFDSAWRAYQYRVGRTGPEQSSATNMNPEKLPTLLFVGNFLESLSTAIDIANRQSIIPLAIAITTDVVLEALLQRNTPLPLVKFALQGLVPIEAVEDRILTTVVSARELSPLLRSPYEGLVYYMLETRDVTRGRFKTNARVAKPSGSGSYEVDFLAADAKLIIEIDGAQHRVGDQIDRDETKQQDLERLGYRIRRFSVQEVSADPVGVWRLIVDRLQCIS
jgi:very-short-patch-repair endonuclease